MLENLAIFFYYHFLDIKQAFLSKIKVELGAAFIVALIQNIKSKNSKFTC